MTKPWIIQDNRLCITDVNRLVFSLTLARNKFLQRFRGEAETREAKEIAEAWYEVQKLDSTTDLK